LELFKPQLKRNREESDRLLYRKRVSLVVSIAITLTAIAVVPSSLAPATAAVCVVLSICVFGYLEVRRFLILRRDLRDRGQ